MASTNTSAPRRLAIACQGGGAVTAFQAGLLPALFKDAEFQDGRIHLLLPDFGNPDSRTRIRYELIGISGTSGGAMNAACCWTALAQAFEDGKKANGNQRQPKDGPDKRIAELVESRLSGFWQAVMAGPLDPSVMGLWFNQMAVNSIRATTGWSQMDLNPEAWPMARWAQARFEDLIREHIRIQDFNNGSAPPLALYVGASEIRSGTFALFARQGYSHGAHIAGDVDVSALAASAAIPTVYPAIRLAMRGFQAEGIRDTARWRKSEKSADTDAVWAQAQENITGHYWDGLYSQNPPLSPFLKARSLAEKADDILVIRANPRVIPEAPRSAADVADRRNELQGNLSLEQEIDGIDSVNKCLAQAKGALDGHYRAVSVWELDLPWSLHKDIRAADKLRRDADFIEYLKSEGKSLGEGFRAGKRKAERRTGRR